MASRKQPWPVLFLCCLLSFNSMGMSFGMGAIFTDLMDIFRVSRATASLVQSVCAGVIFSAGILTGHLQQRQGPRVTVIAGCLLATGGYIIAFLASHIVQVIVGVGVFAGVGLSFLYLTTHIVLGTMFYESRSLALTANAICTATGDAVYPLFYRYLVNEYSVRGTFLVLSAISCQLIVCGALIGLFAARAPGKTAVTKELRKMAEEEEDDANVAADVPAVDEHLGTPRKSGDGNEDCGRYEEGAGDDAAHPCERRCICCSGGDSVCPQDCKKSSCLQLEILRDKTFVVFAVFGASANVLLFHPVMFMTDIVKANHLTEEDGSFFLTIVFSSSILGRVAAGVLYKLLQSRTLYVFSASTAMGGVVCLFFVFARESSHFLAVSAFLGFTIGLTNANISMVHLEILGPKRFSVGRGYAFTITGVFFCLSGPYGGMVRDLTNSYEALFYIAVAYSLSVGMLLFYTARRFHRSSLTASRHPPKE